MELGDRPLSLSPPSLSLSLPFSLSLFFQATATQNLATTANPTYQMPRTEGLFPERISPGLAKSLSLTHSLELYIVFCIRACIFIISIHIYFYKFCATIRVHSETSPPFSGLRGHQGRKAARIRARPFITEPNESNYFPSPLLFGLNSIVSRVASLFALPPSVNGRGKEFPSAFPQMSCDAQECRRLSVTKISP